MNTADVIPANIPCPNCAWPMTAAHDICANCQTEPVEIRDEWHNQLVARTVEAILWS